MSDSAGSITLFPSAHISPSHINTVRERIDEGDYDIVAIELGEERFERAVEGRPPNPLEIIKESGGDIESVVYSTLALVQQSMAALAGTEPGMSDMRAGIEAAAENNGRVALVDRSSEETTKRFKERVDMSTLYDQLTKTDPEVARKLRRRNNMDFDELTNEDNIEEYIDLMREAFPEFVDVFIDERDQYMAERLDRLRRDGHDVFAVVGAGHVPGLRERLAALEEDEDGADVEVVVKTVRAVGKK